LVYTSCLTERWHWHSHSCEITFIVQQTISEEPLPSTLLQLKRLSCLKRFISCLLHTNVCLPIVEQIHADYYEALTWCIQQCLQNYALHNQKCKCSPTPS